MNRLKVSSLSLALVLAFSVFTSVAFAPTAHAATPTLNLTELMYNPASDLDGDEFIELYNTSGAPLDISGWCFTSGVDACFAPSTIVPAGGYVLVGQDATQFNTTYGQTLDLVYASGKLSNGGEQLVLEDASNNTIFDITYDDVAPWPSAPDGGGPSMELKDNLLDPATPTNWASSLSNGGTPGTLNSVANTNNPSISATDNPSFPSPSTNMLVTATTGNTSTATITYKVNFDADVTTPMFDDGTNGDVTAGDGIYSFNIPGQSAGDLIRYRITATNATTSITEPPNGDGMNYRSYIVDDGQTADIPIVRWYMPDADFADMTTNHATDKQQFIAVIAVGDKVYDNAKVRVKGESSTNYAKKKFKFELPTGYSVEPAGFEFPVDEFALNAYFMNLTDLQEPLTWNVFEEIGYTKLQNTNVRVQKNNGANSSSFYGHYLLFEGYDGNWRDRNGYDDGALYKEASDKKTRKDEDNSDIQDLVNNLNTLQGDELKTYLKDNINIPSIVNFHATASVIGHNDWNFYHNIFQYRDTEGTGRWEYLPWDLDLAMTFPILKDGPDEVTSQNVDPMYHANAPFNPNPNTSRLIEDALFQFPEFRDMYSRRVATAYDQLFKTGKILDWYGGLYQSSSDTINEDRILWASERAATYAGFYPGGMPWDFPEDFPLNVTSDELFAGTTTATQQDAVFRYGYGRQVRALEYIRSQGYFPQPQPAQPQITITELMYNPPGGSNHEYLELHNPNNYAVDISGWKLEGLSLTIPQGTVLPSNSYGLVVKNDVAFREHYGGSKFIISEYDGNLDNSGETISLLRTDGSVASAVTYRPGDSGADGGGYSLELIRLGANTTNSACWAPSANVNGTPGSANEPNQSWVGLNGGSCKDVFKEASTGKLAKTGENSSLIILIGLVTTSLGLRLLLFVKKQYYR